MQRRGETIQPRGEIVREGSCLPTQNCEEGKKTKERELTNHKRHHIPKKESLSMFLIETLCSFIPLNTMNECASEDFWMAIIYSLTRFEFWTILHNYLSFVSCFLAVSYMASGRMLRRVKGQSHWQCRFSKYSL